MPVERERVAPARLKRSNTAGERPAERAAPARGKQLSKRGSAPSAPWDPWASDSEEESRKPPPAARRQPPKQPVPKAASERLPAEAPCRPNPLLARAKTPTRKTRLDSQDTTSTVQASDIATGGQVSQQPSPPTTYSPDDVRASPWSTGSRSPSRPNPLLPSSRSPSQTRQATESGSMTPRGVHKERSGSRKRTDGERSPRTPETTDPALYLQSLFPESSQSPPSSPPSPSLTRTEQRHKAVARSLSRLFSDDESLVKQEPPKKAAARPTASRPPATGSVPKPVAEAKSRGRSQPGRRVTELKAASDAAGGGVPLGKAKKPASSTSRPRKTTSAKADIFVERPKPQVLGRGSPQASQELDSTTASSAAAEEDSEKAHLSRTNELLTTFGRDDEFSFVAESSPQESLETPPPRPAQKLEVPVSTQRTAFKEKVFSFGAQEEPGFLHTMEKSLTADLQASAPVQADPFEIRKPRGRFADGPMPVKEGSVPRTPNTNVRLPRFRELPRCPVVSRKSFKASDRMLGCPVPEYADVLRVVQAQLVLGHGWPSDMPSTSILCSLMCWFLPYLLLVAAALLAAVIGLKMQAFVALAPLALLLHVAQALRRGLWDRRLLAAVDQAASADLRDQLRAPLGWGEEGQVFSANLNAALQAVNLPPNALLLPAPGQLTWKRSMLFAVLLLVPGAGLRASREALDRPADFPEVALVTLCSLLLVAFECRPSKELRRSELVDQRLEALEAGFNAMLDTLRPLLGQSGRPAFATQAQAKVPGGIGQPALLERFSVRLITAERFTLRGSLTILQEQCGILVSCPLGDFDLVANGLEGALPADLGKTAAGEGESMALSPQPASGWAAALAARFTSREARPRRDDDLASVSTASTLTRGKGQVDEASLHLALAMVAALSRCGSQPLEVFRALGSGSAVVPPKVSYDEPSLVLAMAEDQLSCHPCHQGVSQGGGCFQGAGGLVIKDRFGVVRDPGEMRQLCTDEEMGHSLSTSWVQLLVSDSHDSPRSSAASQGSGSEDELSHAGASKWPSSTRSNSRGTKLFSVAPHHLALVFDSFAARDRCLELIRQVLPLPTPTASRSKCFPASPP
ncbi:unnamed protein product [Symbiodinium natans]|uniref:Uncharacterized protein n=1 Tax=Symbiodinium natans TaxID=878477 RepID=A0A812I521_9DINO|nr:unnamed protein product [Symbiodinium natans]